MVVISLFWLASFLFLQKGPRWESSPKRMHPGELPPNAAPPGTHPDCRKEQDRCSLELAEARNGVPKAPRNLGLASPKVSQGSKLISRSTCCPLIKPQTSSGPNLKTNDRHTSPLLANSHYSVCAPLSSSRMLGSQTF